MSSCSSLSMTACSSVTSTWEALLKRWVARPTPLACRYDSGATLPTATPSTSSKRSQNSCRHRTTCSVIAGPVPSVTSVIRLRYRVRSIGHRTFSHCCGSSHSKTPTRSKMGWRIVLLCLARATHCFSVLSVRWHFAPR